MAFPTVAATNTSGAVGAGTTSHVVSLPSGISAGDLLVIFFRTGGANVTHDLSGWNEAATRANNGRTTVFWKIADGSEGSTATITSSAGRASAHISYRITGHDGTNPIAAAFVNSQSLDPPNLAPGFGTVDMLWIALATTRRCDNTLTAPTNYGNLLDSPSDDANTSVNHTRIAVARRELNASSEDPGTFGTTGTTDNTHAATIAINPASEPSEPGSVMVKVGGVFVPATTKVKLSGTFVEASSKVKTGGSF